MQARLLETGDEVGLEAWLAPRAGAALALLGNLHRAGLRAGGGARHGSYAGAFEGADLCGVAAHYGDGMVLLEAPGAAADLARLALSASGRPLTGLRGSYDQVEAALARLVPDRAVLSHQSHQVLMICELGGFSGLGDLFDGRPKGCLEEAPPRIRQARGYEVELLANWRQDNQETRGILSLESPLQAMTRLYEERSLWVLEDRGRLVACCATAASWEGRVLLGALHGPLRYGNRGYRRALVAGVLPRLAERGFGQAALFAATAPARRAYGALGFAQVSDLESAFLRAGCGETTYL
jgi:hypothetical protein